MHGTRRQKRAINHTPVAPTFFAVRPVGNHDVGVAILYRAEHFLRMRLCGLRMRIGQFGFKHGPPWTRSAACPHLPPCPISRQGCGAQQNSSKWSVFSSQSQEKPEKYCPARALGTAVATQTGCGCLTDAMTGTYFCGTLYCSISSQHLPTRLYVHWHHRASWHC